MTGVLGFCGLAIIGLAAWNYCLSECNDELTEQHRRLTLEVNRLKDRNNRLLDDVTKQTTQLRDYEDLQEYTTDLRNTVDLLQKNLDAQIDHNEALAAQIPKHDEKGRFKKK